MGLTPGIDLSLTMRCSVARRTGSSSSGEPTRSAPILDVPCFFVSEEKIIRIRGHDEQVSRSQFFFSGDVDITPRSNIVFSGTSYDVISVDKQYDEDGIIHHQEVYCI